MKPARNKLVKSCLAPNLLQGLVEPGDRVLLAVSTGPDSMTMLHLFWRLRKITPRLELRAAYIDHGLRPREIKKEIGTILAAGREYGIPVSIKKINVLAARKNIGTEGAARKLRYAALGQIAGANRCNKIATAHNLNDQAETVMLNLLRSSGREGVSGIPVSRRTEGGATLIRPLLGIKRSEIMSYLKGYGLKYCIDSSNRSVSYTRNRLRHRLFPLLEKINPGIYEHLDNAARWNDIREEYFSDLADGVLSRALRGKGRYSIDLRPYLKYNIYLQYKIVRGLILLNNINGAACLRLADEILEFISGRKVLFISANLRMRKSGGRLYAAFSGQRGKR